MRLPFFVMCLLFASPSLASVEGEYARALARARGPDDIRRAIRDFEEIKVSRAACRLQMRAKQVPLACYETLQLEIRRGMHPRPADRKHISDRLDELCAESARSFKIPRGPYSTSEISGNCRKTLAMAHEIRIYRERRPDWSGN